MTGPDDPRRAPGRAWIALAFGCAAVAILWSSPDGVRPLLISDASEYATSAARFVEGEGFTIRVDGVAHPPRYPAGFPLAFLAPLYAAGGTDALGRGVFAVLASGVAVLLLLRWLCRRCLSTDRAELAAWGTLAAVAALRAFRLSAESIMADLPLLLACGVACLAFVEAWRNGRTRGFLIGGLAAALAFSIRLTGLAFVLPFAFLAWRRRKRGTMPLVAALGPVAAAVAAIATYNTATFGSPVFDGYSYWLGAAPEVTGLAVSRMGRGLFALLMPFTPSAYGARPGALWNPAAAVVSLLILAPALPGLVCRARGAAVWERTRPVLVFLALGALPITVFHLVFPADSRYHLPFHVLWLTLGCIWTAALVTPRFRAAASVVVAGAVAAVLAAFNPWADPDREPAWQRIALEAADRVVPDDGVLVGPISGVLADRLFVRDTERRFVPLDPFSGYASFRVGRAGEQRVGAFAFTGWNAVGIDGLFRAGRRVFLLRRGSTDEREFERRYELVRITSSAPSAQRGAATDADLVVELRPAWRPVFRAGFADGDVSAVPLLREGWHPREWGHLFGRFRFGLGTRSTIVLPVAPRGPLLLQLVLGPSPSGHQDLTLAANGHEIAQLVLDPAFRPYSFVIPDEAVRGAGELELTFLRSGLALPPVAELDPMDPNHLGMAFLWVSLSDCPDGGCPE